MADLDDFFKKKDGRRNKKFVNGGVAVKKKDSADKRHEKAATLTMSFLSNDDDLFSSQNNDEWKEFEPEEKKNYTGLKLQHLKIAQRELGSGDANSDEETEINELGQPVIRKKQTVGPWKQVTEHNQTETAQSNVQAPLEIKKEIKKKQDVIPTTASTILKSAYVPPAKRSDCVRSQDERRQVKKKEETIKESYPALPSSSMTQKKTKGKKE